MDREVRERRRVMRLWIRKAFKMYREWQKVYHRVQIWIRPGDIATGGRIDIDFMLEDLKEVQAVADLTGLAFVIKHCEYRGIIYEALDIAKSEDVAFKVSMWGFKRCGENDLIKTETPQVGFRRVGNGECVDFREAIDQGMILQNIHPKGGD